MQWQWMLFQYLGFNNMSIFLHLSTSSNKLNIVSAKQPRKNSPTTETESGGISLIREVLQVRGTQEQSADLIIQAWRQSTKK